MFTLPEAGGATLAITAKWPGGGGVEQLGTVKMKLPQTLDIRLAVICFSYKINLSSHRSMEDVYPTRAIIFPSVK